MFDVQCSDYSSLGYWGLSIGYWVLNFPAPLRGVSPNSLHSLVLPIRMPFTYAIFGDDTVDEREGSMDRFGTGLRGRILRRVGA